MSKIRADAPDTELAVITAAPLAVRGMPDIQIGRVLEMALDKGIDPASMEKLVGLAERIADRSAAQEFAAAMADFQANCPPVPKMSTAKIATRGGTTYSYQFAELDTIANHVRPMLLKHGLSYTWDSADEAGKITCTCTVRHLNGHSVSAKFTCPTDSAAAMSGAQKSAAALTYARRQSLIQVLGLTTTDPDSDGSAADGAKISESQAADIGCLLDEVGADRKRFLAYFQIERLDQMPLSRHPEAIRMLEEKRMAGR